MQKKHIKQSACRFVGMQSINITYFSWTLSSRNYVIFKTAREISPEQHEIQDDDQTTVVRFWRVATNGSKDGASILRTIFSDEKKGD
jgi:hypothetical protein